MAGTLRLGTLEAFAHECERLLALHRGTDWRILGKPPLDLWLELSGCKHDPVMGRGWVRYRVTSLWTLARNPEAEAARFGVTPLPHTLPGGAICGEAGCNRWSAERFCPDHR